MSTLRTDTLSNAAGTRSIGVDRVAQGTAAAWVNFKGTGTVAIRQAFNVASITDNGTGDYTVNFTTAMSDGDYSVFGLTSNFNGGEPGGIAVRYPARTDGSLPVLRTASAVRIGTGVASGGGAYYDYPEVNLSIFR